MKNAKSDVVLQREVLEALDWEPRVHAAALGVIVKEGVVTLQGTVPSFAQKQAAVEVAQRVFGVKAVVEEMTVQLPHAKERTDVDIAKAVFEALKWHVYLPDHTLAVKVEAGVVTLEGAVEWHYQKEQALEAVRSLTGVRHVINLIQVKPQVTPKDIKTMIRKALTRTADEEADHISVAVQGSEITLGGTVRTAAERADAVRAAWAAPGVTRVTNQIELKYP